MILVHRTSHRGRECPSCHSSELAEETKFDPSEGFAYVHYRDPSDTGIFAAPLRFAIDRARVCLACGHVSLSFGEARLAELRAKIGKLVPIE